MLVSIRIPWVMMDTIVPSKEIIVAVFHKNLLLFSQQSNILWVFIANGVFDDNSEIIFSSSP